MPDSYDPEAAWIFDGVDPNAPIGDFGLAGGGASGLEIDWYDPALGSPPHAFLLASSEGHTSVVTEVRENFGGTVAGLGGDENPNVRNDLVYFTTPNGGAVFSTGSIAWCASLSHDGYDNDVSRITENVIRAFASRLGGRAGGIAPVIIATRLGRIDVARGPVVHLRAEPQHDQPVGRRAGAAARRG